ncbi:MAG: 3-hydroxybutyryl-CoA dehydrogenase [Paracoccaceae bacterium]
MAEIDEINTIAVIGAGQMGTGIAQAFAQAGLTVLLHDVSEDAITGGISRIDAGLMKLVNKGRMADDDAAKAMGLITPAKTLDTLGNADLIIEAATEDEAIKTSIFAALMPHVKPSAIIASNTSSISITRLAAMTDRPEMFLGVHFMNPVPVMQLVELIRGIATNDHVFQTTKNLIKRIGKTATVSEDYPAFIVNRILIPMINEAVYTLYEGVGSITSIDASMKLGANHPMGPFELADFIGLDICLAIMKVLNNGLHDPKYRPCPLLQKYVDAGWLGRKTGRGFYDYRQIPPLPTR